MMTIITRDYLYHSSFLNSMKLPFQPDISCTWLSLYLSKIYPDKCFLSSNFFILSHVNSIHK